MSEVVLNAPFAGWLTPLEEVPDPVFAERMMGDGVAIDPVEKVLRAPADAIVISIPGTAHAVTLRLANGAELLIHIGLETVALGGAGFRALTCAGAQVKTGDPLIEIDLDKVAHGARSLVTPVIVASEGFALSIDRGSRQVAAGDPIGTVRGSKNIAAQGAGEGYERTVLVEAAHGLHARPAARIAALAKQFGADLSVARADRVANAQSTVALMGLGVVKGDEIRIVSRGDRAKAGVDAIVKLIESGFGEGQNALAAAPPTRRTGPICASPGLAIGTIVQLRPSDLPVPRDGIGVAQERELLAQGLTVVASSLGGGSSIAGELAAAHRELLKDPELAAHANAQIAEGRSAAFAWRSACDVAREAIRATGDPLLIERAADLLDLERRVISALSGETGAGAIDLPDQAIVVARDLLPSEFLDFDTARVAGICTAGGGPTSHVAILAASAGIPMFVAAGDTVLELREGATAILDADHCMLDADPSADRVAKARAQIDGQRARRAAEVRAAPDPCFTADGVRIEIFANIASVAETEAAVAAGAEGSGLLRTEFLFLGRDAPPDEDEQRQAYSDIAAALGERPLIVRTIDIGADKKVPYLGTGAEENPALGLRGIRLSLARPDLFQTQLKAILRGVPTTQCRIMLPMVADVAELREARAALEAARIAVGAEPVPLGIMVETPAAAMLAGELAADADFLSVGTNDLAQYALAADRTNASVSAMLDAFHPAVLRLIGQTAEGAKAHHRAIGVCGGLASDPLAASILIGLGVTELSAAPGAVPAVKAAVRRLTMERCGELAKRARDAASAEEARAIAAEALA